ncbi:hypothetical protein [Chryseobacterium potabilaquae]|uniref:Uncharacterized protein n=1 Tax=Chryseobacterium potabilaquae TaxID=2675057 RepID=A0A6N4X5R1_9FLAO|nr:hypothetical protein [Chryseobacterium potabilaquae]CAA7193630.1 hypothetical protein CHRY9293_00042 [Chryseobacterium potabilaquae]
MIKTNYFLTYLSLALLLTSCRTEDTNFEDQAHYPSEAQSNGRVNAKAFDQFTKDKGLKLIATFPMKKSAEKNDGAFTFTHIKEKMTAVQVKEMGLNDERILGLVRQNAFHNENIDGVTINDYTTARAYSEFNLAEKYGWWTYIETGAPIITPVNSSDPDEVKVIMSGTEVTAGTSGNPNYEKSIEYTQESVLTKSIYRNVGVTTSTAFGIYGMGFNAEVELKNKNGVSSETKDTHKFIEKISYSIPANKKIAIYMVQTIKKNSIKYEVPVSITGRIGINYSKPIEGLGYFNEYSADTIFEKMRKKQTGTISAQLYSDVKVFVKELDLNEKAPDIKSVFNLKQ